MSHFTVLVIGENAEEQFIPFREKDGDNVPEQYLEFVETETKNLKQYNKEFTSEWHPRNHTEIKKHQHEMIQKSKGEEISLKIDDVFSTFNVGDRTALDFWVESKKKDGKRKSKTVYVEVTDSQRVMRQPQGNGSYIYITVKKIKAPAKVSFKDKYKTFEEFMEDYCGEHKRDAKKGVYGYWRNPNAKWDWYQLGGRWNGTFKIKETAKFAVVGEQSFFGTPAEKGWADQAFKKDIDFEGMREQGRQDAEKSWNEIQEEIKSGKKIELLYFTHGYKNQTKEQYIKNRTSFHTFAVLKDGKWYEKGSMGWWGMVADEKDENKWQDEFDKLIVDLPDDTLLSVYDCHI